jgi:leader peptidase (prepilin peptidase)/N-methyltransferase
MTGLAFGILAFVFGTIVGSFLNVCIYRLPRGESIIYPPSHCPKCYQPIRAEDNLPVLSWFLLRARCRSCRQSISPVYPVIEFLTGALFFLYYWRLAGFYAEPAWGTTALYVVHVAFLSALLAATVIDFKHYIIPDEISIPGIIVAAIASFALPAMHSEALLPSNPHMNSLIASLLGAAAGAGIVYGIGAAGQFLLGKEAMGMGDVKLMAMIGAVLGWQLTILVLFLSALLGAIYGAIRLAFTGDTKIPYGPFLSVAAGGILIMRPEVADFVQSVIQSYRFLLR